MTAQVHWLTGTTDQDEESVLSLVDEVTGGFGFEVMTAGKWLYRRRVRTVEGVEVLSDPHSPETMPAVCVNVPGEACDSLGAGKVRRLAAFLKLTRVDFAWDGPPFAVSDVAEWVDSGQTRTRARGGREIRPLGGGSGGRTAGIGSRNSTWQLVVYDRRGPVRVEMRLRGVRAAQASELLAGDPAGWSAGFLGVLRGLVDFVDRSGDVRGDRAPLLASWERFVQGASRVVVRITEGVSPTLERARGWLRTQVGPTLWAWAQAGGDVLDLVAHGEVVASRRVRRRALAWSGGALSPG